MPTSRGVTPPALRLEFFGMDLRVTGTAHIPKIQFMFGAHEVAESRSAHLLHVEFAVPPAATSGQPPAPREPETQVLVRRDDGTVLMHRTFRGWGNTPPLVPPFAVWQDRFAVVPAVVLAKDGATVALIGSAHSAKVGASVALARSGWHFVSGQLLVIDRRGGHVLPYLAPLEARGPAMAALRDAGLPDNAYRMTVSPVTGGALLVRPESLGQVVPLRSRLARPNLIRICADANEGAALERWQFRPTCWPVEARDELADLPTYRLTVPEVGGSDEAAGLIEEQRRVEPAESKEEDAWCDAQAMAQESRAGSIA